MFSVNGDIKVGDNVVLVCKYNSNEDEDVTDYYAIAVVEYYENENDRYSNVIYADEATKYVVVNSSGNTVNQ